MLYGKNKTREIARSVLPSTRRRAARGNAAILKRRNRRQTRLTLHAWKAMENAFDFEGHVFDYIYGWGDDENIKMNVSSRREGDKLGALMQWAPKVTAHLDDAEDRYMFVKRALPDSLIGRHALSHVAFLEGFDFENRFPWRYVTRASQAERHEWAKRGEVAAIKSTVEGLLGVGGHAALNRRLRAVHVMGHVRVSRGRSENWNCAGCPLRLCGGWHDVDAFAEALVKSRSLHGADIDAVYAVWRELLPRRLDA